MSKYYLPGSGGQVENNSNNEPVPMSPLLQTYSPRLFGAPPQLTHLNDMRLLSADDNRFNTPGPVGDFYLTKILQDSQIVNIAVGRAVFTGGMNTFRTGLQTLVNYSKAIAKYDIFGNDGSSAVDTGTSEIIAQEIELESLRRAVSTEVNSKPTSDEPAKDTSSESTGIHGGGGSHRGGIDEDAVTMSDAGTAGLTELDSNVAVANLKDLKGEAGKLSDLFGGQLLAPLMTSLSVQQPFYTFESDWYSYINNVKMMINTAVIMLGLQKAGVRIGDCLYPIGMDAKVDKESDVWSNYRFITPKDGLGMVTALDSFDGDTSQYVSFMCESSGVNESFSNDVGDSLIYSSVIEQDNGLGAEIAFLTSSSQNVIDDAVINIAGAATAKAEEILTKLTGGVGRFTAAILGSLGRSFTGDHTIYPQIFKKHNSTSNMSLKVHLSASGGDPYSYLIDVLVPYFHILGLVLPKMSKNSASAYNYPPLVQCNIPGMWGTRLGIVKSVSTTKNPDGKGVSIHGYPLSIDVTIEIADLQHTLVTSGMNEVSVFLNNSTMFDYIAQCAGVDKYRVNPSIRLVSRLALAASAVNNGNFFYNLGEAPMVNDFTSFVNRLSGVYRF